MQLASAIVGPDGNGVTLQLIADGSGAGSLDETAWPALKFHFAAATTTAQNLVDAVNAGTKLEVDIIGVAGALFETEDAQTLDFAGGAGETWRVVNCDRYRNFWKATLERLDRP